MSSSSLYDDDDSATDTVDEEELLENAKTENRKLSSVLGEAMHYIHVLLNDIKYGLTIFTEAKYELEGMLNAYQMMFSHNDLSKYSRAKMEHLLQYGENLRMLLLENAIDRERLNAYKDKLTKRYYSKLLDILKAQDQETFEEAVDCFFALRVQKKFGQVKAGQQGTMSGNKTTTTTKQWSDYKIQSRNRRHSV